MTGAESPDLSPPELVAFALRINRKLAASRNQLHREHDLAGVALEALARALAAHEPSRGKIKPFAAAWISLELRRALKEGAKRAARERPLDDADDPAVEHPSMQAEELVHETMDALLSLYAGQDLRSNGEAMLLERESHAALHRAIDGLAEDDRRLVELRGFQDLTTERAAEELGIGERTVRDRFARIREELKEAILASDRVRPLRRKP